LKKSSSAPSRLLAISGRWSVLESGSILVGTPDDINKQLQDYVDVAGSFEILSLQVNFNCLSKDDAEASMRLFGKTVIPKFQ